MSDAYAKMFDVVGRPYEPITCPGCGTLTYWPRKGCCREAKLRAAEILAKLVLGEAVDGVDGLPDGMALDTSELKRHYARVVLGRTAP